ncbi:hypothetical protein [Streptomyces tubercidicus]|uniref:hypothetical protein n=1 Tax=Streptomyces tubercidicus TaxID=47759 RepID=UPI0034670040
MCPTTAAHAACGQPVRLPDRYDAAGNPPGFMLRQLFRSSLRRCRPALAVQGRLISALLRFISIHRFVLAILFVRLIVAENSSTYRIEEGSP